MSWDGTLVLVPKPPKTSEEQKRFAMSTGLRFEDLARIAAPHPSVPGFFPRATKRSVVQVAGGGERIFVNGVTSEYSFLMDRPIGLGRGITEDDQRRHSTVAVVGATLASKLFGGSDPVGRDLVIEGVPYRIVGVLAGGQIFNEELYQDANGVLIPLETYMDRLDTDHQLTLVAVKLNSKRDLDEVSAVMVSRPRQAHHGIEDVEVKDLDAELARGYADFQNQMDGWAGQRPLPRALRSVPLGARRQPLRPRRRLGSSRSCSPSPSASIPRSARPACRRWRRCGRPPGPPAPGTTEVPRRRKAGEDAGEARVEQPAYPAAGRGRARSS